MPLKEHVYSVLLVSAAEKFSASLLTLLPERNYYPVQVVGSITEAQRRILEQPYDLALINTPLPDDFGMKFAVDVCAEKNTVAMLFVKSELYADVYDKVADYGVLTLSRPTSTSMVKQSLDFMKATRERLYRLERKTVSLENKMAEIRTVNRAKWALIESQGMTEAEAHRYIEKAAMDNCVSRLVIAERILRQ